MNTEIAPNLPENPDFGQSVGEYVKNTVDFSKSEAVSVNESNNCSETTAKHFPNPLDMWVFSIFIMGGEQVHMGGEQVHKILRSSVCACSSL